MHRLRVCKYRPTTFSRYTSEEAARAEARFYIAEAQRLNLPKNTLMVNDFEDAKMQPNINRNTKLGRTKCVKMVTPT